MKNVNKIVCVVAALYLVGLVAVAPIATAQGGDRPVSISAEGTPTVKGTSAAGRLAPETATAQVTAKFVVTVPGPSACVGQLITVSYKVLEKPAYATITLAPGSEAKPFTGGQSGNQADQFASSGGYAWSGWETQAVVAFTRSAPAFQDIPIKIEATVTAGAGTSSGCTATGSGTKAIGETSIKADYLPSIQILPDAIIQTSGQNKKVLFPITVINFSNGPTRVAGEVIERTKGLNAVVPPAELFLESKATSGEKAQNTQQVFVTVLTPNKNGYTNKVYSFDAVFRARSDTAGQDLLTSEISVPLSVKVQGVYVPGFDSTMMIAGLGIALVGLSVRRRHE